MTQPPSRDNTNRRDSKTAQRGLTRALAEPVQAVTRRALGSRSLAETSLLTEWSSIAGSDIAHAAWPRRIIFPKKGQRSEGTLVLRVLSGQAPRIGHMEPIIIERVNGFFGYKAVAKIRLEQGPLPKAKARPRTVKPPPSPAQTEAAARDVAPVEDPDIKAALARLGQALRQDDPNGESGGQV